MEEIIEQLKKYAKKNFGKRCKVWCPLCCVCEFYRAIDTIEYLLLDEDSKYVKLKIDEQKE